MEFKKFQPSDFEEKIYQFWLDNKFFEPIKKSLRLKNFSIILPPPNVTGHLHLGHAWDGAIQDCMIRYKKMCGFRTIFIPGTDHAGISTQTKFSKILTEKEIDYAKWDDEKFLVECHKWALEQASFIKKQWGKLGLALAYNYNTFTLDKNVYDLIYHEFISLYKKKLIYRDFKLVNWDVKLKTAISDIEVIHKKTNSHLYYFKYYLSGNKKIFLEVATTRPETMFVDTNLVINHKDKRYLKYVGMKFINPINDQDLILISDHTIDASFGTGVMKCTPAHDFFDYELAKRHKITNYHSVIELDGKLNNYANTKYGNYEALDRLIARKKIVEEMKKRQLISKIVAYESNIGYSERSNEVVEPLLSMQWFVKMQPIVNQFLTINKKQPVNLIPKRFFGAIKYWMDNVQDWCISRQLLWGHKIPAWYHKKTNAIYVGKKPPADKQNYYQEKDVLDTWFSSGLWPLVQTKYHWRKNVSDFYPIDLLVTGYDILTFWVSRMLFQCSFIDNSVSLKNVFIHGLVRDENNQKMSKSLGNVIDPLDLIKEYGADALRYTLITNTTINGDDLSFHQEKIKHGWAFINKIFNCANLIDFTKKVFNLDKLKKSPISLWILNELNDCIASVRKHMDHFRLSLALKAIEEFSWNVFCNQYLEIRKAIDAYEFKIISYYVYDSILKMLHPFCPFVTEYIYHSNYQKNTILLTNFPCLYKLKLSKKELDVTKKFLTAIRLIRDFRIKNSISSKVVMSIYTSDIASFFLPLLSQLNIELVGNLNGGIKIIEKSIEVTIFNQASNLEKLNQKLLKHFDELKFEISRSAKILSNKAFLQNANKDKVNLEKKKYQQYLEEFNKIKKAMNK